MLDESYSMTHAERMAACLTGGAAVAKTLMINCKKFEMRIDIPNAIRLNRKRFEANICARYLIWNKEVIKP